ncbi:unnamed protein product [Adineta steineri]|uniref:NAD(P)(+)--arginine ADP-ribosyltransferase n=1 Tax=Adineta steineri TaxID=433720 RepID=A0A819MMQ4_9BILA|nr:unnamed protein product [Adineta steineri]CAF3983179.1 unnamed protein product [Adineta steineri]
MNDQRSTLLNSSIRVEWMWQSNLGHLDKSQTAEWCRFPDVENAIIEEAFLAKKTYATLDNYHIDFEHLVQISDRSAEKERAIKRLVCSENERSIRADRLSINATDLVSPSDSLCDPYGWISTFILAVRNDLNLGERQLPSTDETIVPIIVQKAADGIIEEGMLLGKQCVADWMANQLVDRKDKGIKEVWKCCARLYSMASFLYEKLNEPMRLIGKKDHEHVWRSKVHTLGPFCLLLWDNPFSNKPNNEKHQLYRGINLSDTQIAAYKDHCQRPNTYYSFQAFTSCSRNRDLAELYGNVLFIMEVNYAFTVDLQPFSNFYDEEETLITPGVCFTIQQVDFDKTTDKHVIYLNIVQRFNKYDTLENSTQKSDTVYNHHENRIVDIDLPYLNHLGIRADDRIILDPAHYDIIRYVSRDGIYHIVPGADDDGGHWKDHVFCDCKDHDKNDSNHFLQESSPNDSEQNEHHRNNKIKTVDVLRHILTDTGSDTRWQQNGRTVAGGNSHGSEVNQLWAPVGFSVDNDQTIYVADQNNHRIMKWTYGAANGEVVAGGNGLGSQNDQLNTPSDVIIDKNSNSLIISDFCNRRVVRWAHPGGTQGETIIADIPCSNLTMDDQGFLYVSAPEEHVVRRWRIGENDGIVVAGGNEEGNSLKQLSLPTFIFVDRDQSVYVSDMNNHRVVKWVKGAQEGIIVAGSIGRGSDLAHLDCPQGVVVDELGTVYVADYGNHRVMCWPKGAQYGYVIVDGNRLDAQPNQLNDPISLAFDQQNNLYVSDLQMHRVQRFDAR